MQQDIILGRKKSPEKLFVALATILVLVSCSSPSSPSSNTTSPANTTTAPSVVAAISATSVATGTLVTLTATASPGATLAWNQISGTAVTLTGATSSSATFSPTVAGSYSFDVVASNSGGSTTSNTVSLTVTVPVPGAPTVSASISSASVTIGTTVTLTATVTAGASLVWSQVSGPTVALTGATTASASITPTAAGVYAFHVVATNAGGSTTSNTVSVTVSTPAPTASASISETSGVLFDTVTLTATATSGATLLWTEVSAPTGSTAVISNGTTASATIVPDVAGTYVFNVTATNAGGAVTSGNVSVNISDPLAGTWKLSWPNGSLTMYETFIFSNGVWSNAQTNSGNANSYVVTGSYVETSAGSVNLAESSAVQTIGGTPTISHPGFTATYSFSISGGVVTWTLVSGALGNIPVWTPSTKQ